MIYVYLVVLFLVLLALVTFIKVRQLNLGKLQAEQELKQIQIKKIKNPGSVERLSILPLIDFYTADKELRTEPGVSYLIKADDTTILMDVGYNQNKEHPSPLLHNMRKLNIEGTDIDMIFISHPHLDHLGGMKEQKKKLFSLSQGPVKLRNVPVYAPSELSPSRWNPEPQQTYIIREPISLKPGIASIGVHPRYLFLMGHTKEHSLAIHVTGKGVVLIIGCGHQTVGRIIDRAQSLFDEPIYAIIGGLHLPVKGGRIMKGSVNIQHIVGSDNPPWKGLGEADVKNAIEAVKKVQPAIVSLSAHDSSDWSIAQFKNAFGERYTELKVGQEIVM